jgi:ABC-type proline/glycine betaine transport system substrate-binding protein
MKNSIRTTLAIGAAGVIAATGVGCSTGGSDNAGGGEEGDYIAVTLWRPHWAYDAYDIKDLEDPEGALGETESIYSYSRTGFGDDNPQAAEWISDFAMSSDLLYSLENVLYNENAGADLEEYPGFVEEWAADNQEYVDGLSDATDIGDDEGSISIAVFNGWPEGEAVSYLWQHVLENAGYTVELEYADAAPVFLGLSEGDYDVTLDVWLPLTHAAYVEQYGDDVVELGAWNDEAVLTVAVSADAPIDSLDELAENADLFGNRIVGIEPGAGLTAAMEDAVIPGYGLEDMDFSTSSTPAMLSELARSQG